MKFRIEDVRVSTRSLGLFGTGQSLKLTHQPSGITVEVQQEKRLLTAKEKNSLLAEPELKVRQTR